jgi:phage shock protein A
MDNQYRELLQKIEDSGKAHEAAIRKAREDMKAGYDELRSMILKVERVMARQTASIDQAMTAMEATHTAHRQNIGVVIDLILSRTDRSEDRLDRIEERLDALEEKAS